MSLATDAEGTLLRQVIMAKGGSKPVFDSFNHSMRSEIPKIVNSFPLITYDKNIALFENVSIVRPTLNDLISSGKPRPLYPSEARRRLLSYMSPLFAKLQIYQNIDGKLVPIPGQQVDVFLGKIPAMILSELDRLSTMTPKQRYEHGEGEIDCGGYFIIKGSEKVLLHIEKLRELTPFMYEEKGKVRVRYTSRTLTETPTLVIVGEDKNNIYVTFTKIGINTTFINMFCIFYALGFATKTVEKCFRLMDTFIIDSDPRRQERRRRELRNYLQTTANTFTGLISSGERRFYEYLAGKYTDKTILNSYNRNLEIINNIRAEIFRNVPLQYRNASELESILMTKMRMLAAMVVKYVDFRNGYREVDDRDAWGNKRLVDPGSHVTTRFLSIWKTIVRDIQTKIDNNQLTTSMAIRGVIKQNALTEQFIDSFSKELWGSTRGTREVVVVDTLKRDTPLASFAHIRRISTPTNRRAKIRDKRLIHNTQWGAVCPVMTPEGEACGLVKDAAVTTYISLNSDENVVKARLQGRFVLIPTELMLYSLYLNGVHLGYCDSPELYKELINLRRTQQQLFFTTGIIFDQYKDLWIFTNAERICRPLLIVNSETQDLVIDERNLRGRSLFDLLNEGAMEYIDIVEQEQPHIFIAETVDKLRRRREDLRITAERYETLRNDPNTPPEELRNAEKALKELRVAKKYTHAEIDPTAILGISASIIPLPEFNPAARDVYQAGMGKQALGPNSTRLELRFDTTMRTITEPGVPIFTTDAHETLGLDEYPAGQQVTIAITTYGGENQEDAIIFNEGAIQRGLFWMALYYSYKTTICQSKNFTEQIQTPEYPANQAHRYAKLDSTTHIVRVGQYVESGDCLVGKIIVDNKTGQVKNGSLYVEIGKKGVIEEVFITENAESCKLIRIRIREYRMPQVGDKFASRYAQKGTIGGMIPEAFMPFISSSNPALAGVRPDIIFNPHGLPSRMTIGKLIEILVGRVAVMRGERINATAFRRFNYEQFQDELFGLGFSRSGKEKMINGITGREMDVDIFIGPTYYQLLRHLVEDKMQARGTGAVQFLTRQPPSGIRKEGGLRMGEMERDALVEHGSSYLLQERMVVSSDAYQAIVCQGCGILAVSNEQGEFRCQRCRNGTFGRITIPYTNKYLIQLLSASNIRMRLRTREL